MNTTTNFASIYGAPRAGVAAQPLQQQANAGPSSLGVGNMLRSTGQNVSNVTGMELPMLIAIGAVAWLLIYLD